MTIYLKYNRNDVLSTKSGGFVMGRSTPGSTLSGLLGGEHVYTFHISILSDFIGVGNGQKVSLYLLFLKMA